MSIDMTTTIAVLSIIVALASALIALLAWKQAKDTLIHQTFYEIQKEYRTVEMLFSVRTLWEFYRKNGRAKFVDKYEEIRKNDIIRITQLPPGERLLAEQTTLHHIRRLVSQFYQMIASLYVNKILPGTIVYRFWSEEDLRIIPEILVPIENRLNEVVHDPPKPPLRDNSPLLLLYKDSIKKLSCF